ncbi:hypothetical protein [Sinorhizobium medicae]|uniref:Gfo/Idh/MocA family protein n=1 Tax=Sinorhizobium medicae TaxID=110321 RepID=UPI0039C423CD
MDREIIADGWRAHNDGDSGIGRRQTLPQALSARFIDIPDLSSFVGGRLLDDDANVLMRFGGGVKGMLWVSQVAPGNENALLIRIFGSEGGVEWAQEETNHLRFSRSASLSESQRGQAGPSDATGITRHGFRPAILRVGSKASRKFTAMRLR